MTNYVASADGTKIAFDRLGAGSSVILVTGASVTRGIHTQLAELLAQEFTVFNYDRRGRGESDDTPPYAVEREIEDLGALIGEAGGAAAVFGSSSGGVLALRATASGLPVNKLAVWEPPFMLDPDAPRRQHEYATELSRLLEEGRRGDAAELFMKLVGVPDEMIAGMRSSPMWSDMEAVAPSLAYDAEVMGDSTVPTGLLSSVTAPTMVLNGGETGEWAANAADAVSAAVPDGRRESLVGQTHNVSMEVLAPALMNFFRIDVETR